MRKEVILTTLGLRAGYGGKPVLQGLEIEVRESEIVAVIGRNGVGKSTLMKSLIGLVPAMSGSIVYRGEAVEQLPAHKRARLGMGYVPQGRDVFPRLTVGENMAVGAAIKGGGIPEEGRRRVVDAFPILQERWSQRAGTMSGGQQQQLAIGRVLIADPHLILLDEPSEGIQPNIVQDIARNMVELNRKTGVTIILVEQNLDMIRAMAQRAYVMDKGRITASLAREALDDAAEMRRHLAV
ncbi:MULTISPECIES: ABC transporter ATP-binding protein [Bradyrhizobium]|jgi:urea ABC transporter ATP-binding protein UrtE|uniref:ABC transporter ATP-binding protein n=3 Tax=Pseudomonadota TaxID=1224 RepID=A0ABS5GC47_9BRAD|nr:MULTISPECIES: ABC transporter ATP-binding protein [Bradyrhizobium]RTM02246.1 MAG: ABC transporter ATP-binding protein [Bradyrhizobiaceae bacterium]ABQ35318.1 amino acid/amide ABC transporter ATP-binding protein 2, HAAT family [Bradyrhizobium sp. BTAi1]MBR1138181.1 ABC transporter ATP-binding protein [Bradyrhizobium denitrificans]MCL8489209.1 ABC transporter ATP-binding protein [Bradyrhizobium denitrificans]MDU0953839.1 ABC transporter ATP-binding protein [Bradyrhizobium sp.]